LLPTFLATRPSLPILALSLEKVNISTKQHLAVCLVLALQLTYS
jgi:hypothetical protein